MKPLPVPINILAMMAAAALGILYGRKLYARGVRLGLKTDVRQTGLLAVAGFSCIAISFSLLTLKNFPRAVWLMPATCEYYMVPASWLMTVGTVGFMGGAMGLMALQQRRLALWLLPLGCIGVFGGGEWAIQNSPWYKDPELQAAKVDKDGVIRQSHGSTCAAAACANVASKLGIPSTERQMVECLGTTDDGTSPGQIIHGMRRLGFECRKRLIHDADFTQLEPPAVLLVTYGTMPLGHAVAFMGIKDGKAEIWNPVSGKSLMTREQLAEIWLGHAVEVGKKVE